MKSATNMNILGDVLTAASFDTETIAPVSNRKMLALSRRGSPKQGTPALFGSPAEKVLIFPNENGNGYSFTSSRLLFKQSVSELVLQAM